MAIVTVHINNERDLPTLQVLLNQLGLEYQITDNNLEDVSFLEMEGIKAGLDDIDANRIYSNEEAKVRIADKLKALSLRK